MYQQICYKLIDVDLSRQKNTCIPQELNFTGKLENDCTTMFFLAEKPQKDSKDFKDSFNCHRIIYVMEHQKVLN